jgi:hypothetical protein
MGSVQYSAKHLGLPSGDAGVRLTITHMERVALGKEGALNPEVRIWALDVTRDARDRDDRDQATAIYAAVKRVIRFRGEYSETIQTPLVTLQVRAGDCDDHATLIAALLRSIGIPARFKTVAVDPTDPTRQFSHVYALAGLRRGNRIAEWMPMDTTVPYATVGWEVPNPTRTQVWGEAMSGLYLGIPGDGSDGNDIAADDQPPPQLLSQKVYDGVAIINAVGGNISQNIAAARQRNGANVLATSAPSGVQGKVSASLSPMTLSVLGLAVVGVLLQISGKKR